MKNKIAALVMAIAMALSFAACSDGGDDSSSAPETVTVTETAEPTPEPVEPPSLDAPSDTYDPLRPPDTPEQNLSQAEVIFLDVLKENTTEFAADSDEALLGLADEICKAWDRGVTFNEIADVMIQSGYSPTDGGFFIGAATQSFCPQHVSKIG